MTKANLYLLFGIGLALLPSILGVPIFWYLPWNSWIPTSTTTSRSSASSSSPQTTKAPINASISIGNRMNTTALDDMGTLIENLTINRGRRALPSNESIIQIGNQIIRLPPGNLSNLTISIIDGVPYIGRWPPSTTEKTEEGPSPGLFGRIRTFLDELFKSN
ncbi:uncharacterized protein LOC131685027 [Topomyia yanbarensis]|uniref:uncharacterized protein LOC131685027 n=1 Tax=Topomyia yanbarensis TaxID=2498891 RepID=UPI00273ACE97|nr:uncharacterized protein LOC131685027 [Topomyia yanbarensis]